MFFDCIRSERKLIETSRLNLAHRWHLGYALDEDLTDHSSLTRIRQRLGIEIFQTRRDPTLKHRVAVDGAMDCEEPSVILRRGSDEVVALAVD